MIDLWIAPTSTAHHQQQHPPAITQPAEPRPGPSIEEMGPDEASIAAWAKEIRHGNLV